MFRTNVEKIKTHILSSVTFFFIFENRAVYEIIWKNIVQPDKPPKAICCMRFECCLPEAKNIHSEYVILIAFTLQQWLHESAWLLTL